jgi:hypothetical protein
MARFLASLFASRLRPRDSRIGRRTRHFSGGRRSRARLGLELLEQRALLVADVGDSVWLDSNDDGLKDSGEAGVPGAVAELFGSNNSPFRRRPERGR